MENIIITDYEFQNRLTAFQKAEPRSKLYITLYTVFSEIRADQTTFDQWSDACLVEDLPLQKLAVQRMSELAKTSDEWLETCSWAYCIGLNDIGESALKKYAEDDDIDIEQWIKVYREHTDKRIRNAAFQIIAAKKLTFEQWLEFCDIGDCEQTHMEYALQQLYLSESLYSEWVKICANGHYDGELRLLALRMVSEKECTFDDLLNAFDASGYDSEFRKVVMQRYSEFDATEDQWRDACVCDMYGELGELANKKVFEMMKK